MANIWIQRGTVMGLVLYKRADDTLLKQNCSLVSLIAHAYTSLMEIDESKSATNSNSSQTMKRRPAVYAEVKAISRLGSVEIERMYSIFSKYYANHTREHFTEDLFEKDHVILLRDSKQNTIQGFSTLLRTQMNDVDVNALGIFSGDTVLEKEYWGNKALGVAFLKYLWTEKMKSPLRPVYWFLISKGYKTYLLMANNFRTHYPRFEKETPAHYEMIMDKFYGKRFSQHYKPESGTIEFDKDSTYLKEQVAEISAELKTNPRVQFFTNRNPHWNRGHELACIAEMTLLMPLQYFLKKTFFKLE